MPTAVEEQLSRVASNDLASGAQTYQRVMDERAAAAAPGGVSGAPDPYSVASIDAAGEAARAEQARLEAEHSRLATSAAQAARGILDFVMAPAALAGAQYETMGNIGQSDVTRSFVNSGLGGAALGALGPAGGLITAAAAAPAEAWHGLADFGRNLGTAAQGSEAMATLFGAPTTEAVKSLVGAKNNAEAAQSSYERTRQDLAEQQKAWPMLSTVSHLSGMVAAGIATGGLSTAAKLPTVFGRVANAATLGTAEGAANGAQAAYGDDRPLRDVLGATVTGGLLGGVTAGAFQGASEAFTSKAFGEGLTDFARERSGKALGLIQKDYKALGGEEEASRLIDDVAGHVLGDGTTVLPKSPLAALRTTQEDIAERIARGAEETGAKLGEMRESASAFIDESAPELRPKVADIIGRIRKETLDDLEKSPILKSRMGAIQDVLDEIESKTVQNTKTAVRGPELDVNVNAFDRSSMRDESFKYLRSDAAKGADGADRLGPPRIDVWPNEEGGEASAVVGDGRHRMTLAHENGAKSIRANVVHYDTEGNIVSEGLQDVGLSGGSSKVGWRSAVTKVPQRSVVETAAGKDISVNDLRGIQENLKSKLYPKVFTAVPEAKLELQKVERILEDTIEQAVDKAAPKMGLAEAGAYKTARQQARSFIQANEIMQGARNRGAGNNMFSLRDTLASTAAFAGDVASGGMGLGSVVKAGVTGIASKFARERGPAFMAALANKLAGNSRRTASVLSDLIGKGQEVAMDSESEKMSPLLQSFGVLGSLAPKQYISVDAAGGRQAQSVIQTLADARRKVHDAVESAGPNPTARQAAQLEAQQRIATELAAKAGPFDPVTWQQVPPSPLQKVIHRPEILNQVATDLASSAQRAVALRPSTDFDLNPDRIKKLTKGANGPLAIGNVQEATRLLGANAPATPTGDQIKLLAGQTIQQLAEADVPGALSIGHALTRQLALFSQAAHAEVTRSYIASQVSQMQQALGNQAFGKAGEAYAKLTGAPGDTAALTDPGTIRSELANAQARGATPDSLKQLTSAVLDAHEAKRLLGGGGADKSVARAMSSLVDQFHAAQDAVTLDGGPAGRVFDFFKTGNSADVTGLRGSPQTIVLNAVRPQMERLLPVLGKDPERYAGTAAEHPSAPEMPKSTGELASLYRERMANLASAVTSPDPDAGGELHGLPSIPPAMASAVVSDSQQRMAQLLADMPKPTANVRGKAYETLSSADLRKADAMWEATTKPMSVFADFHAGTLDYDKAQYAWKQYPGLQQAAQAGLMDALHAHLDDDERAAIPDSVLTQCDYLLGFNGTLQSSVDRGFASRMTALGDQQQQAPKPTASLELPGAEPTYTERLAGAKG